MHKTIELDLAKELKKEHFRVTIFGSARIQKGDKIYEQVFDLAKMIGERSYDIITGGGPGLMEAANAGHTAGDKGNKAESIGLRIELSFEQNVNEFVEVKKKFSRFAERLETFVALSDVFIISPGGIGTTLEFFYAWQLVQVKKSEFKPIILIGEMWEKLIYWIIDYALKEGLVSSTDFDYIYIAKNNEEAMDLIDKFDQQYKTQNGKLTPIKEERDKLFSEEKAS